MSVSADGDRVIFLRSTGPEDPVDRLWVYDVGTGTERLIADPADAADATAPTCPPRSGRCASGCAYRRPASARTRSTRPARSPCSRSPGGCTGPTCATGDGHPTYRRTGPVVDPRLDPAGRRIAYVTGGKLHVINAEGDDALLAGEEGVTWGLAEFIAAEEFHRFRGYWWSPDGRTILAARVDESRVPRWHLHDPAAPADGADLGGLSRTPVRANAEVTLHVLDLDGGWVDVHWDRETYPYLVAVSWSDAGGPLIAVLRRLQQHGLVLAVDARTGETQVHAELADPRWVEPVTGTPAYLPDGRVLVGGELAHEGFDARCLFADGSLLTPPNLYVRRVVRPDRATTWSSRPARASPASSTSSGCRCGRRARPRPAGVTPTAGLALGRRRRRHDRDRGPVARPRRAGVHRVPRRRRGRHARLARRASRRTHRGRRWSASPTGGCPPASSTRATTCPGAGCRCSSTSTAGRGTRRWSRSARGGRSGSGGPTPGSRSS